MSDSVGQVAEDCPRCGKRTLLRAVIDEVQGALAGEPERHEHFEFVVCPVCGWNDLPERWEKNRH